MENLKIRLTFVLAMSVAIYLAASVSTLFIVKSRLVTGDIELLLPGGVILIGTLFLWFGLLDRYQIYRRITGAIIVFLFGFGATIIVSIGYPLLRTGALWENPGELGGAVLFVIMFMSLITQLLGFIAGFIPSAIFIRHRIRSYPKVIVSIDNRNVQNI